MTRMPCFNTPSRGSKVCAKAETLWSAKKRAWQARKTPEGLEAIDSADQELADIGRNRTGPHR